jgi:ABC-type phosphate/phosphonate transport system substrate-binding protein
MKVPKFMSGLVVACAIILIITHGLAHASHFTVAIMQDEKDAAQRYKALKAYLAYKGIQISFVETANYSSAAAMFATGKVDAMFSGSAIAGIFIMKELAVPLVRPLGKDNISTYHAVVLGPKGSPKFSGSADYFKGKKVALTALASSGEVYFRSIPDIAVAQANILKLASHGACIDALSKGAVNIAVVKNRVWEKHKKEYPGVETVGEDTAENPDNALIVSLQVDAGAASRVSAALLDLKTDTSPEAKSVRDHMEIKGFIKTTLADFKHTIDLLRKAGVSKSFNFQF